MNGHPRIFSLIKSIATHLGAPAMVSVANFSSGTSTAIYRIRTADAADGPPGAIDIIGGRAVTSCLAGIIALVRGGIGHAPRTPGSRVARGTWLVTLPGLLLAVVSGCELLKPPVAPADPVALHNTAKTAVVPHEQKIAQLLEEAQCAFSRDRLTTPAEDNAYIILLQILALDPANTAAERGISDIVERYLEWSITSANAGELRRAVDFLRKARSVDAVHPNIAAVSALVESATRAETRHFRFGPAELSARTAAVAEQIRQIGSGIDVARTSVVITARSDAEGRWIYQQLNDASDARVRAELLFGDEPGIRVVSEAPEP